MNRGLKSYCKLLTQTIGSAGTSAINLCREDSNYHLNIPLVTTTGRCPIDLSLCFSLADRATISEFGRGMRINLYRALANTNPDNEIEPEFKNADGSTDIFEYESNDTIGNFKYYNYTCQESQNSMVLKYLKFESIPLSYTLTSKSGDVSEFNYNPISYSYPTKITMANGTEYSITQSNNIISSISNGIGDVIEFAYENGLVSSITVKKNTLTIAIITFAFNAQSYLTAIELNTIQDEDEYTQYSNNYTYVIDNGATDHILVKDALSGYQIKYFLSNISTTGFIPAVTSFKDGYDSDLTGGATTSIEYFEKYTTTTDYLGNAVKTYFDNRGLVSFELDGLGNTSASYYNANRNLLGTTAPFNNNPGINYDTTLLTDGYFECERAESATEVIYQDPSLLDNTFIVKELYSAWDTTNFAITDTPIDTSMPIGSYFDYKVLSVENRLFSFDYTFSQEISVAGLNSDAVSFIIWGKETAYETLTATPAYIKLTAKRNGAIVPGGISVANFEAINGYWKILTTSISPLASYDTITIAITVKHGYSMYFQAAQVYLKQLGSFYQYSDNGSVVSNTIGDSTTLTNYTSTGNRISNIYNPSSSIQDMTYDNHGNMTSATAPHDVKIQNDFTLSTNNLNSTEVSLGDKVFRTSSTYNPNGYLTSKTDDFGKTISYTYDETFGRLADFTDPNGAKTAYRYDNWGQVVETVLSKNGQSTQTNYTYDTMHRIDKITLANNMVYKFTYDDEGKVTSICVGNSESPSFALLDCSYETKDGVSTGNVIHKGYENAGDDYGFVYDNKGRLTDVRFKDASATTYTTLFTYSYDDDNRIIGYVDNVSSSSFTYTYDENSKLVKIMDNLANYVSYSYDNLGTIISKKIYMGGKTQYLTYDSKYRTPGLDEHALYSSFQDNNYQYCTCFMQETVAPSNTTSILDCRRKITDSKGRAWEDRIVPATGKTYFSINRSEKLGKITYTDSTPEFLSYSVPTCAEGEKSSETISFWFKPSASCVGKYLFSTGIASSYPNSIAVRFNTDNKLELIYWNYAGIEVSNVLVSEKTPVTGAWNFFSITWNNVYGYAPSNDNNYFEMHLNDECIYKYYTSYVIDMYMTTIRANIGFYYFSSSPAYHFVGDIAAIMISRGCSLNSSTTEYYYKTIKDYLTTSKYTDEDLETVEASAVNIYTQNQNILSQYDIFPLNNSVLSIKGTKPTAFEQRRIAAYDRDRTFNYSSAIKRYAYVADGDELVYPFNSPDSGTIAMKVFIKETSTPQYLFKETDSFGRGFGLYRGANNVIYINFWNVNYSTGFTIPNNQWKYVALSWSKSISGDSSDTIVYTFNCTVGTSSCIFVCCPSESFLNMSLSIGRLKNAVIIKNPDNPNTLGVLETTTYPLNGLIEMLATSPTYQSASTLAALESALDVTTITKQYDEFGRILGTAIVTDGTTIHKHDYTYRPCSNDSTRQSTKILSDEITIGTINIQDMYGYDNNGNIALVSNNFGNEHSYSYDYRGFLTSEEDYIRNRLMEYSYDINGNILSATTYETLEDSEIDVDTYTYDTDIGADHWADRLISFSNTKDGNTITKSIKYDTQMAGNPKYYGTFDEQGNFVSGITYTWDGRRLASLTDNTNTTTVQYKYNDKGLRTKKTVNGVDHYYYYDGDMLVCETCDTITKRFIYDENGMVTSFILKNGTTENIYHYVRDIFGIINYLIDSSGTIVVVYSYDSWGKLLSTGGTLSSTVGVLNPFLYKGYYFDVETSMYYCQSRYYIPLWRRWLNADSVDNLDEKSSNGFNLFAYCGNNPVNYVDPSGCSPWWSWLISGIQLLGGIALCLVPGGQGIGLNLIIGGALGLIANAATPAISQAIGGASSIANGWGAFSTGTSILGLGIPGLIGGLALMAVGGATMAFGANEIVAAATGTNYIQQWTGMSDTAYGWTYFGLNLTSSLGQMAGNAYRLHQTRTPRLSHDGLTTKGYRYKDAKGNLLYDFDYPHGNINYSHYHGIPGGDLVNRTSGQHWSYLELIWWMLSGR